MKPQIVPGYFLNFIWKKHFVRSSWNLILVNYNEVTTFYAQWESGFACESWLFYYSKRWENIFTSFMQVHRHFSERRRCFNLRTGIEITSLGKDRRWIHITTGCTAPKFTRMCVAIFIKQKRSWRLNKNIWGWCSKWSKCYS